MLLSARGRHNAELADHRDYDERANGAAETSAAPLPVGDGRHNFPFLCRRVTVVKTGDSNSRALICWVRPG
jgi:hypothetical protein